MDDFIDTKNQVERVLSEIKDNNVSLDNYKSFVSKLRSAEGIIETQIGTLQNRHSEQKKELSENEESERYKNSEKQGFIPKDTVTFHKRVNETLREAYSWKALETQLFSLLFDKMNQILEDVNALDIKKGVLEEMRDMENKRNALFIETVKRNNQMIEEIVNNKLTIIDDKVVSGIKSTVKEMIEDRKSILLAFSEIMSDSSADRKRFLDIIKNYERKSPTEEYEKIKKPISPIGKKSVKKKEEKKVTKVDSDPFGTPADDVELSIDKEDESDEDEEDDIEMIDDEDIEGFK